MADNIFSKQNGDFTRVLPPVISGTPQRSLDADSVLARANAMLAQTKAQGSTPFAGSSYERALPPPTYQNAPILQTSVAQVTPTPPPQTEPLTTNPYDAFNLLLQESLKKAQTLNPTDLLKQQRELQRQRIAKISGSTGAGGQSITPEEARFLSPAQQESIRNSGMDANSTAIDEVQYQIQKVNQDKKDLLEQIMFAKDSGDKMRTAALEKEYKLKDAEFKNAQLAETIRNNKADQATSGATLAETIRHNKAQESGNGGLSSGDLNRFNAVVSKYNASPLIAASDRVVVLKNSIANVRKDPGNASLQLNLVYSYIQALDTYQSAVREGELGLVNSIDSKIGQLANSIQQIQNGQLVRPDVAIQIADASDKIVNTINDGAKQKSKSFESQANTLGLGKQWKEYTAGFTPGFNSGNTTNAPISLPANIDTALSSNAKTDDSAKTVTIPRSVWSTFGASMDSVKAGIEAKGYTLLIN